jgi:hypothetical protein
VTNLLRDTPDWLHTVSFTPVGTYDPNEMSALLRRLKGKHSRDSFLEELLATIRRTADKLPGVPAGLSEHPTQAADNLPASGSPSQRDKCAGCIVSPTTATSSAVRVSSSTSSRSRAENDSTVLAASYLRR